jgi:hypothetical protein
LLGREADCFSGERGFRCGSGGFVGCSVCTGCPPPPGLACGRILVLSIHFDRRPPPLLRLGLCGHAPAFGSVVWVKSDCLERSSGFGCCFRLDVLVSRRFCLCQRTMRAATQVCNGTNHYPHLALFAMSALYHLKPLTPQVVRSNR